MLKIGGKEISMKIQHLLAEAFNCLGPLNDHKILSDLLKYTAQKIKAKQYGEVSICYVPHGVTAVIFLAESHMMITTWPEHKIALVDILLCGNTNVDQALNIINETIIPTGKINKKKINRVLLM